MKLGQRAHKATDPVGSVTRLHGGDALHHLLERQRAYATFAIGCLDPRHASSTEWWQAESSDGSALLMHAHTGIGPSLFAMGDPAALEVALSFHPGPLFTFATFQIEHTPIMERFFSIVNRQPMQRMIVTRAAFRQTGKKAIRLTASDLSRVNRLYGKEGGQYTSRHLQEGLYYGVTQDGELVAIAGTHVISPSEGVAVVGNVYTHPKYRNRGYATAATAAVTEELLSSCATVALTVDPKNTPAVRAYRKLGYSAEGLLMESPARRRDVLGLGSMLRRCFSDNVVHTG